MIIVFLLDCLGEYYQLKGYYLIQGIDTGTCMYMCVYKQIHIYIYTYVDTLLNMHSFIKAL